MTIPLWTDCSETTNFFFRLQNEACSLSTDDEVQIRITIVNVAGSSGTNEVNFSFAVTAGYCIKSLDGLV